MDIERAVKAHSRWLNSGLSKQDATAEDCRPANFIMGELRGANFEGVHLSWAGFKGADLRTTRLRGANLCGADFCAANLRGADLSNTALGYANLTGANLTGADLTGADLRNAKLFQTNLTDVKGFKLLQVQDPRGFPFAHAVLVNDEWRIRVGCRNFTVERALEHWGPDYQGERSIGDSYIRAIEWFMSA